MEIIRFFKVDKWDSELKGFKGSLFLSQAFLNSLSIDNTQLIYYKFFEDDKLIGMVSGLERPVHNQDHKQLFFFAGIATRDNSAETISTCKKQLINLAIEQGYLRIFFKSYDYTSYTPVAVKDFIVARSRSEYVLELNKSEDEFLKVVANDIKRRAKKAKAEGVEFKYTFDLHMLEKLDFLLGETLQIRKEKGYSKYDAYIMPFIDKSSLSYLLDNHFAALFYAEFKGEIISMQFTMLNQDRAFAVLMGTSKKGYELNAAPFLWLHVALYLLTNGYYQFNLGGVSQGQTNAGLRKFKLSLGPHIYNSCEESTDLLQKGFIWTNLLLKIKRGINHHKIPWRIQKKVIPVIDWLMKNIDRP